MKKLLCVVSAPIDTYSGYGARSRDFVKSLIEAKPDWDIVILSQRWGNTRFGYLRAHDEAELMSRVTVKVGRLPEVWIQITVPNEFKKIGKYNIGITAGIETTLCSPEWVQGMNNMDLVLVSSRHAKEVFDMTKYNQQDNVTKQVTARLEVTSKVEVLFEGADINKYFPIRNDSESSVVLALDKIEEKFCYLYVGHWLPGDLGEDRKNTGLTIKSFLETFKNKKDAPALILKVNISTTSVIDRDQLEIKIDQIRATVRGATLPNIYIFHGDVTDQEMNSLYNHPKVKAMVSLSKGEGFGRPLLEFSLVGKPIIASNWSGHRDFLTQEFNLMVGGELQKIHPSAVQDKVLVQDSQWFRPAEKSIGAAWKGIYKDYKKWLTLAKRQAYRSKTEFSMEAMTKRLGDILEANVPNIPVEQVLEMPIPKLNLPTLKKVE